MRSEKVYALTKLVQDKIEQLEKGNRSMKQRFRDMDQQAEHQRTMVRSEHKVLQEDLDDVISFTQEQDDELAAFAQHEKALKTKLANEVQDMKDRILCMRLGKEKAQGELAEVTAEIAAERRKFDCFLDKDRDKLKYAKDVLQTRALVMRSFEKELARKKQKTKLN